MCMRICFFGFKKHTQIKKFALANLFVQIYVLLLSKDKILGSLLFKKKSAVRVVFKCKLYLKNLIKLIKKKFCGHPDEDFFRHPHFPKQKYYFFGLRILKIFFVGDSRSF